MKGLEIPALGEIVEQMTLLSVKDQNGTATLESSCKIFRYSITLENQKKKQWSPVLADGKK